MIKLWRKLICPVMVAAEVKTIVEIGAEYGTSTAVLLKYVNAHSGHLSCIDPAPEFDPSDLPETAPQNFSFYRDLSLNVLPALTQFDAALIDGDHNWYSVYHELKQIEVLHRHSPLQQPLIFVHDISWPYGRRDLYYDPSTIPAEYRQAHQVGGLLPNHSELCAAQGLNTSLNHATHEGGKRNGVLTAVEDYIEDSALKFRLFKFPLYFGLGILVTKERLASNPGLAKVLHDYESAEGARQIAQFAEHLRSVDGIMMQTIGRRLAAAELRIAELEAQLETDNGKALDGEAR